MPRRPSTKRAATAAAETYASSGSDVPSVASPGSPTRLPAGAVLSANRVLPLLLLLFVGSGSAALIYEIVWFQMLQLIVGSSAISLGVVLGTFMGGMCVGSLALSRVISATKHPLRVYAALEGAIGLCGLVILVVLPYAGGLYTAIAVHGMSGLLLRGLFCAVCLLPPTLLMGATLPAIGRWVQATPEGVSWLGFFYGGNIAGAVFGCLLAGFYLLRAHDVATASFVAVAINACVAAAGYALSRVVPYAAPPAEVRSRPWAMELNSWPVYLTIALSGMTALGAEAVWTRLLTLTLGATVYTFSLILAAFLVGLGIGSSIGSFLARGLRHPERALGICQLLLMGAIAWAAYSFAKALPYWPVNPGLSTSPVFTFQIDVVRCLWVVIPGALLWGMSFPLALAAVGAGIAREGGRGAASGSGERQDTGELVGTVYAANTVGGIIGALCGSLLVIAWLGTQDAQRILIAIAGLAALPMFVFAGRGTRAARPGAGGRDSDAREGIRLWQPRLSRSGMAWGVATVLVAAILVWSVAPIPGLLVAYGRYMVTWLTSAGEIVYVGEGMNASVAVTRMANGVLNYHNAGKVQASSEPQDMRLQRMLGHLTTLVPAHPRSVLVIGCGAGVTAGAVSVDPGVERETIAEIEPLVPRVVSTYFSAHNFDVIRNPKVHVQIDDARHFILTTDEKFDAVTSDPLDPWVKGAATLYTQEFFDVVKQHLNPGGVVTLFVQLYESNVDAVKSEVATFMQAFPNGIIWGNTQNGEGYDLVLLGQLSPTQINVDSVEQRLQRPEYAVVRRSLQEIGFNSAVDLFSTYAGRGTDIAPWLKDAQVNHDWNLRLQYLAGLGLNKYEQASIYRSMLAYRRYPDGLFTGAPDRLQALRAQIGGFGSSGHQ